MKKKLDSCQRIAFVGGTGVGKSSMIENMIDPIALKFVKMRGKGAIRTTLVAFQYKLRAMEERRKFIKITIHLKTEAEAMQPLRERLINAFYDAMKLNMVPNSDATNQELEKVTSAFIKKAYNEFDLNSLYNEAFAYESDEKLNYLKEKIKKLYVKVKNTSRLLPLKRSKDLSNKKIHIKNKEVIRTAISKDGFKDMVKEILHEIWNAHDILYSDFKICEEYIDEDKYNTTVEYIVNLLENDCNSEEIKRIFQRLYVSKHLQEIASLVELELPSNPVYFTSYEERLNGNKSNKLNVDLNIIDHKGLESGNLERESVNLNTALSSLNFDTLVFVDKLFTYGEDMKHYIKDFSYLKKDFDCFVALTQKDLVVQDLIEDKLEELEEMNISDEKSSELLINAVNNANFKIETKIIELKNSLEEYGEQRQRGCVRISSNVTTITAVKPRVLKNEIASGVYNTNSILNFLKLITNRYKENMQLVNVKASNEENDVAIELNIDFKDHKFRYIVTEMMNELRKMFIKKQVEQYYNIVPYWTSVYTLLDKISYGVGHITELEAALDKGYKNFIIQPGENVRFAVEKVKSDFIKYIRNNLKFINIDVNEWSKDQEDKLMIEFDKNFINYFNYSFSIDLTYKALKQGRVKNTNLYDSYVYAGDHYTKYYKGLLDLYIKQLQDDTYIMAVLSKNLNQVFDMTVERVVRARPI